MLCSHIRLLIGFDKKIAVTYEVFINTARLFANQFMKTNSKPSPVNCKCRMICEVASVVLKCTYLFKLLAKQLFNTAE